MKCKILEEIPNKITELETVDEVIKELQFIVSQNDGEVKVEFSGCDDVACINTYCFRYETDEEYARRIASDTMQANMYKKHIADEYHKIFGDDLK